MVAKLNSQGMYFDQKRDQCEEMALRNECNPDILVGVQVAKCSRCLSATFVAVL
jgi:hypothetical protein